METSENNYTYVLVAGGREFADTRWMSQTVESVVRNNVGNTVRLIHGGARGADRLAGAEAQARGIEVGVFAAEWDRHGRAAGYRRNERMARFLAKKRDLGAHVVVILFPGGKGTAHMRQIAKAHRLPVYAPPAKSVGEHAPSTSEVSESDRRREEAFEVALERVLDTVQ